MTHRSGWLPDDLHIVSDADLLLLQRGAQSPCRQGTAGRFRASPWSGGLERVLDELERRDVATPEP